MNGICDFYKNAAHDSLSYYSLSIASIIVAITLFFSGFVSFSFFMILSELIVFIGEGKLIKVIINGKNQ